MNVIADVQNHPDHRNLPIDAVGIKNLRLPVVLKTAQGPHPSVATISMTVALPPEQKGTHMSRFVALMEEHRNDIDMADLKKLAGAMLTKLGAEEGTVVLELPFFRTKRAPVSGIESLMDYGLNLSVAVADGRSSQCVKVVVPVTSLCPCSKEISAYGAHNQRSHVTITLWDAPQVSLEEIIDTAENQASCQLYGVLKRPDEKFVTEHAYDNPKFVEDLVRDIAQTLEADPRIGAFEVESENFESIHNHSAYACIRKPARP